MDGYSTRFYTCLPDRCYETVEGVQFSAKLSDTDEDNSEGVDCDETLTEKKKEVVFLLLYFLVSSVHRWSVHTWVVHTFYLWTYHVWTEQRWAEAECGVVEENGLLFDLSFVITRFFVRFHVPFKLHIFFFRRARTTLGVRVRTTLTLEVVSFVSIREFWNVERQGRKRNRKPRRNPRRYTWIVITSCFRVCP